MDEQKANEQREELHDEEVYRDNNKECQGNGEEVSELEDGHNI